MADDGTQRLLGNDFRQDNVLVRIVEGGARRGQSRSVRGVHIATVSQVVLAGFFVGFDGNRLVLHIVGAEVVGQIELGGGAGLDADGGAVKFLGAFDALGLADQEALTVIVRGVDIVQLDVDITDECPGGVTDEDVAFLRVQKGKAGLTGGGDKLHLFATAENRGRDRAAHVGVETLPTAGLVGIREARKTGIDDAVKHAPGFDVFQRPGSRRLGSKS